MTVKRIVISSNFDDEMFNEEFVNLPPMEEEKAQHICRELNDIDPSGPRYYKAVDLDYQLYTFKP